MLSCRNCKKAIAIFCLANFTPKIFENSKAAEIGSSVEPFRLLCHIWKQAEKVSAACMLKLPLGQRGNTGYAR
eukprot:m.161405 g.161405  ORF g.161405 m.161405 type:complete len:73 (+) comp38817_c0_seq13:848-1066(+)